ncbi:unnamed protein product [Cylicocyclus nassatus]|uniref:Uncharacterized protein n=1 Tax=Cylicocyclus nassatus TaxID=53992 RepID=A0AA36DRQ5_CYLNA|nr:unnamed protein product [Cylicocyclus nassatus]
MVCPYATIAAIYSCVLVANRDECYTAARRQPATAKANKYHVSRYFKDFVLNSRKAMLLTSSLAKSGLACNHRLKMFCLGLETVTPIITATDDVATDKARTKRAITCEWDEATRSPFAANRPETDMPRILAHI